jgi:hypothetical protein
MQQSRRAPRNGGMAKKRAPNTAKDRIKYMAKEGTKNKDRKPIRTRKQGHQEQGKEGTKNKEKRAIRTRKGGH